MSIRSRHIRLIKEVAGALGDLNERVVYVGGAVVSLYVTDPAARDVRPTDDVDITLEITSLGKLEALRQELIEKGFRQSPEDSVMCRFRYKGTKVDVMATREIGWAPANPWFGPGLKDLRQIEVDPFTLRILSMPYFLATKISAFRSRSKDPRTSHDLEDVVYVLDNRDDIAAEIRSAPEDVKCYLAGEFEELLKNASIKEAMIANLEYGIQAERFALIEVQLREVLHAQ